MFCSLFIGVEARRGGTFEGTLQRDLYKNGAMQIKLLSFNLRQQRKATTRTDDSSAGGGGGGGGSGGSGGKGGVEGGGVRFERQKGWPTEMQAAMGLGTPWPPWCPRQVT